MLPVFPAFQVNQAGAGVGAGTFCKDLITRQCRNGLYAFNTLLLSSAVFPLPGSFFRSDEPGGVCITA